ncbi:MAG TPA: 30S ribosomal protein S2 [Candidatus Nanoarchaeia archaeon]|nr:30S ribosomal protein S2 [uncultured archaeon]
MSKLPSLKELLEAGVHFGHESRRWNPKMAPYIFGTREKIHVIDLEKTEKALEEAVDFVTDLVSKGGTLVMLSTKRQAQEIVKAEAQRVGAFYLTNRWPGGLFTNHDEVAKTVAKMTELEEKSKDETYTKREQLLMVRNLEKIEQTLGGIRGLEGLPDAIFVVDSRKENNAVLEARKMGVKIVAMVDSNSDPTKVDYPIPSNDDAIRSISLIVKTIADAYEEGKGLAEKKRVADEKKAAKEEAKAAKEAEDEAVKVEEEAAIEKAEELEKEAVREETESIKAKNEKLIKEEVKP